MNRFALIAVASLLVGSIPAAARADSVEVKAGGVDAKVGDKGVSVKAGNTKVEIENGKVFIAIGKSARKRRLAVSKPIVLNCSGNEEKVVTGLYIEAKKGDGLRVSGNCELTVRDSYIEVSGYAVRAEGNSEVVIQNSTLKGAKGAVLATNNADVRATGTELDGRIVKKDAADVEQD